MRQSIFDTIGNLDTLIAVVIGALLATFGALFAEWFQERLNRKRRERDAARFFGEILASIDRILDFAFETQKIGDEWGSVTQRVFETALREAVVYERNRERLFDIHDALLRERIHTHFLMETFPIEALVKSCEQIEHVEINEAQKSGLSNKMKARLDDLRAGRQRALGALRREHAKTREICNALEVIAGVKFSYFTRVETAAQQLADLQEGVDGRVNDATLKTVSQVLK